MKKNIIQIKGVKKAYKEIEVLKGVDFEVEQGGIFALLGSNGEYSGAAKPPVRS